MLNGNIVAFAIFQPSESALAGPRDVAVVVDIHPTAKNMNGVPTYMLNLRVDIVVIPNLSDVMQAFAQCFTLLQGIHQSKDLVGDVEL